MPHNRLGAIIAPLVYQSLLADLRVGCRDVPSLRETRAHRARLRHHLVVADHELRESLRSLALYSSGLSKPSISRALVLVILRANRGLTAYDLDATLGPLQVVPDAPDVHSPSSTSTGRGSS